LFTVNLPNHGVDGLGKSIATYPREDSIPLAPGYNPGYLDWASSSIGFFYYQCCGIMSV